MFREFANKKYIESAAERRERLLTETDRARRALRTAQQDATLNNALFRVVGQMQGSELRRRKGGI